MDDHGFKKLQEREEARLEAPYDKGGYFYDYEKEALEHEEYLERQMDAYLWHY